jgi:tellurium resistance protein TerD
MSEPLLVPERSLDGGAVVQLDVSWDEGSRPTDVDLQCCVFDSMGLMLDACFYAQLSAADGALLHSGDIDAKAAAGAGERVTITVSKLPPHAYGVVAGVYCSTTGTLATVAKLTVRATNFQNNDPCPLGERTVAGGSVGASPGMLAFLLHRTSMTEWVPVMLSTRVDARTFAAALPAMQQLLHVDPAMVAELKGAQPVFNLTKGCAQPLPMGIDTVSFGLGWDAGCDVDASVMCYKSTGFIPWDSTVSFANMDEYGGAIHHRGDNKTGGGDGDDEVIDIRLSAIPAKISHVFCVVNIFSGSSSFADVKNTSVRIFDPAPGGKTFMRYSALEGHAGFNGVVLGCLFRDESCTGRWQFKAIGLGAKGRRASNLVIECQDLMSNGLDAGPLQRKAGDDGCPCSVM